MVIKYLLDQSGQFWGAFNKSFADTLLQERDRPLKEALLKAQLEHLNVGNEGTRQKIQTEKDQAQAVQDWSTAVQTGKDEPVMEQPLGPATETGEMPAPIQTGTKHRALTTEEQMPYALKINPKDIAKGLAVQSGLGVGRAQAVGTPADMMRRWITANPDATFEQQMEAFSRIAGDPTYARSAANKQAREAEIESGPGQHAFIPPKQTPFPSAPGTAAPTGGVQPSRAAQAPLVGASPQTQPAPAATVPPGTSPVQPPSGSTPALRNKEREAEIRRKEQALPQGLEDTLAKGGTLEYLENEIRKSVLGPDGKLDMSLFNPFAGPAEMEMRQRFGEYGKYLGLGDRRLSPQETTFRQNLQSLQNLIVYLQSGKQINESEAKRLGAVMPQPYDPANFLTSLERFRGELTAIMNEHKKYAGTSRGDLPNVPSGRVGGDVAPAGEQIYNYGGKKYIIRNGQVFEVR